MFAESAKIATCSGSYEVISKSFGIVYFPLGGAAALVTGCEVRGDA